MTNAITTYKSTGLVRNMDDALSAARAMAASGFFQDSREASQAVVKIMAGAEMGFGPFASMTGIHIVKGRPAIGANLIAAAIKNDPRYDYRVVELTDKMCSLDFYEAGQKVGNSAFSIEDARKAGTQNLDKFARNMLFARAISNGAKWYCPGIFGGAPVYTPEELGAQVDGEGNVIDAQPAPAIQRTAAQVTEELGYNDANYPTLDVPTMAQAQQGDQRPAPRPNKTQPINPVAALVEWGISENTPAAANLMNRYVKTHAGPVDADALKAWATLYRKWRDAGSDTTAAAENADAGAEI